jgi:TIR domain
MTAITGEVPGRIFVSYRREETAYPAGWLFDRLVGQFGRDQIFKDVDSIELGDDFIEVITAAVGACDVLLALIGDQWVTMTGQDGRRRLDDPHDFVRLEIEAALTRNVRVIPILVEGAQMPRADELPASLATLVRRQALELSPSRFDSDTRRLLKVLDRAITEAQDRASQRSAASYQRGRSAEAAENWDSAITEYTAVTETDPDYLDAGKRLADCTTHQKIASLLEELRMHVGASEWQAVIAVSGELTALGAKSAEVDRAAKTARQQIRREEEASRAGSEQPGRHGLAAGLAAVAGDRSSRKQRTEEADTGRAQDASGRTGGEWRIFYASHFPILGLTMITVPLFILVLYTLHIITIATLTPYWVITVLGLAGIAGSVIDHRNGCGASAVAVGANCAWLAGYAGFLLVATSHHLLTPDNLNLFFQLFSAVTGIGFIVNGLILIFAFRRSRALHKYVIDTPLLLFVIFMTSALAVLSVSSALINGPLLVGLARVAGIMLLAALLAELTGTVLAFVRATQGTPRSERG